MADVRLLFEALRGPHDGDRRSWAAVGARPIPAMLRVLCVPTLDDAPIDPEIAASCRAAAQRLSALGHRVDEGPLPLDLGFMTQGWPVIGQICLAWLFERHPQWRNGASAKDRAMAEAGAAISAPALWQILETNDMRFFDRGGFVRADDFSGYVGDAIAALLPESRLAPRMLTIGLHARIIGRPGRIAGLDDLLHQVTGLGEAASVMTRESIARAWLAAMAPART